MTVARAFLQMFHMYCYGNHRITLTSSKQKIWVYSFHLGNALHDSLQGLANVYLNAFISHLMYQMRGATRKDAEVGARPLLNDTGDVKAKQETSGVERGGK